jgi:hypothetical protein
MKNVTITLNANTAAWARKHAAQRNMSLSRFVAQLLERTMHESREYERAMRSYLSKRPTKLTKNGARYPRRAELYD